MTTKNNVDRFGKIKGSNITFKKGASQIIEASVRSMEAFETENCHCLMKQTKEKKKKLWARLFL